MQTISGFSCQTLSRANYQGRGSCNWPTQASKAQLSSLPPYLVASIFELLLSGSCCSLLFFSFLLPYSSSSTLPFAECSYHLVILFCLFHLPPLHHQLLTAVIIVN